MNNYDFKILDFICSSPDPVRMCDITAKFGPAGHEAAKQLAASHLISWETESGSALSRDDYGVMTPTTKGTLEHQRHSYNSQLTRREKWFNRLIGALGSLVFYLATEHLLPLIISWLKTL